MQLISDQATRILEAGPRSLEEQNRSISEEDELSDSSEHLDLVRADQQVEDDSPWEISSHSSSDSQFKTQDHRSETVSFQGAIAANIPTSKLALTVAPLTADLEPSSYIAQLYHSINFTITCLYKLPIRHPAPLDRLRQKDSIDTSPYQHYDVLYVRHKFPKLGADVSSRLGKMITRRRQLLRLRETHHQNLEHRRPEAKATTSFSSTANLILIRSRNLEPDEPQAKATTSSSSIADLTIIGNHHTLKTKATMRKFAEPLTEEQLYAPSIPESNLSVTSSYTHRELDIEIPPRPKGENGDELDYFECPYCKVAKYIRTKHQWK